MAERGTRCERLRWGDERGSSVWIGAPGLWCAVMTRRESADGAFATSRPSMLSLVLDGALDLVLGPAE